MAIHGNQPTNLQQTRSRNMILASKINLKSNVNIHTKVKNRLRIILLWPLQFVVYYFSSDVELKKLPHLGIVF